MLDPTVLSAVTAIVTSIIGGLCVAVPSLLNARKNAALMEFQLDQITETVKDMKSKLDEVADIKAEIGKINVRLDGVEKDIEGLKMI